MAESLPRCSRRLATRGTYEGSALNLARDRGDARRLPPRQPQRAPRLPFVAFRQDGLERERGVEPHHLKLVEHPRAVTLAIPNKVHSGIGPPSQLLGCNNYDFT